jgi:hypothetical protein
MPQQHEILFLTNLIRFHFIYLTLAGSLSDCLKTKRKQREREMKKGRKKNYKTKERNESNEIKKQKLFPTGFPYVCKTGLKGALNSGQSNSETVTFQFNM